MSEAEWLNRPLSLAEISRLFAQRGSTLYGGEALSQLAHALQSAALAEAAAAEPELITACLLHDVGHLVQARPGGHEEQALPLLRGRFGAAVTEPIRLHVLAKRYLCAVEPGYWAALSAASQRSLAQQGGVFTAAQAIAFIGQPYASDAVQLRRWDDRAKVVGSATPDFAHFERLMHTCQR